MRLTFTVGDAPKGAHIKLLKADGSIDDTYQSPEFGYTSADSGQTTSMDGSSSFGANSSGKDIDIAVTALKASEKDADGVSIPSVIFFDADSDASSDTFIVPTTIEVVVLEAKDDAVTAEAVEIPA